MKVRVLLILLVTFLISSSTLLSTTLPWNGAKSYGAVNPTPPQEYEIGKEIVGRRTESSKTYFLGKGQYQIEISSGIVHYKDDYGNSTEEWKDIDLTWDGKRLTTTPYELLVEENKVSFTDKKTGDYVAISADLSAINVTPFNEGVKLQRTIQAAKDVRPAQFTIEVKGESILIYASATDATGASIPIEYSIKDGVLTETITELKTVEGKEIVFPITIDPTFEVQPSSKDNYITEIAPDINYGSEAYIKVGKTATGAGYIYRGLVEFDAEWDTRGDITITEAKLYLYWAGSLEGSGAGRTYNAHRLLRRDWAELIYSTWQTYAYGYPVWLQWTTYGAASIGNDITNTDMAQGTITSGWTIWTITNQVITAYENDWIVDCRIADNSETSGQLVQFCSKEYGTAIYRPKLTITYQSVPIMDTTACTNLAPTYLTANGNIVDAGGSTVTQRGFCYKESAVAGWFSPTGYNDPDSQWTNEANAYDENTGTYATGTTSSTSYLELTLGSATDCSKVRYYISVGQTMDLDVYYEGAWHGVYNGAVTLNQWVEKSIPAGTKSVSKARIYIIQAAGAPRLNEFDFYAPEPTTSDDKIYETGTFGAGSYSMVIGQGDYGEDELEPETSYAVRAYAVNSKGTGYGDTVIGTTTEIWVPQVDTDACTDITATSMAGNADITYDGGSTVTRRGFTYAEGLKYSLEFEGDDYVFIQDASELRLGTTFSVELWIHPTENTAAWTRLVGKGDSTYRNYGIWRASDGDILFQIYSAGGNGNCWNDAGAGDILNVAVGETAHIAATYDGVVMKLYRDGVLGKYLAYSQTPYTSSDPLTIGYAGFSAYFKGWEDDVRVWNDVRTLTEIQNNMFSELTGSESNLVGYWDCNEGSGLTIEDSTSNDNDGEAVASVIPILNQGFETGDPPSDWTYIDGGSQSRSSEQKKEGSYSLKTTNALDTQKRAYQSISGYEAYKGKTVVLGMFVWASVSDRANITIYDGASVTHSSYHTGDSSWQWLTVTHTVSMSATGLYVYARISAGSVISAYFDDVRFGEAGGTWEYQEWDLLELTIKQPVYGAHDTGLHGGGYEKFGQLRDVTSCYITSLAFSLKKSDNPSGNVTFTIRDSDGNLLASKVWGDAADLSTDWAWIEVTFDTPVYVDEEVMLLAEYNGNDWVWMANNLYFPDYPNNAIGWYYGFGWIEYPIEDVVHYYKFCLSLVSVDGSFGEGEYSLTIEDLTPNTYYRVCGFAENSAGAGYGGVVVAQTLSCSPDISNSPISWLVNGGVAVVESSEYATGLTYFTIINNSGGSIDISIGGTDMIGGGYTWTLSDTATPGDMTYGMKSGLEGEDYTVIVKKNIPYNTLVSSLPHLSEQDWGLKLYTPTNFDEEDTNSKEGTITITAVCS